VIDLGKTKARVEDAEVVVSCRISTKESSMSVKAEIHRALCELPFLDKRDRLGLISRVLSELQTQRNSVLGRVRPEKCFWMDTLISSTSSALTEIAAMDDTEFELVLTEFERLLETLDSLDVKPQPLLTIH
jgi:aspartyl-tRNA synthetase